ncbi:TetR/AcrR family transcriptional regulator [Williamsia sp. SKLECPSW1]
MRSDAERNRADIVDAARRMLVETGDVTPSRVARQAGVGQGTLYRHFADRESLIGAVYASEIDDLTAAARTLASERSPVDALRAWLVRLADYAVVKRGVMTAVSASTWSDVSSATHGLLGDAVSELLHAGRVSGDLRDDVDARDVILLVWFLSRIGPDEWEERVPRLLDVLVNGLRSPGSATSPTI